MVSNILNIIRTSFLEIVFASNFVWKEISELLDNSMSGKAIHTFVFEGRYGIKEKLGYSSNAKSTLETNVLNQVLEASNKRIFQIFNSQQC